MPSRRVTDPENPTKPVGLMPAGFNNFFVTFQPFLDPCDDSKPTLSAGSLGLWSEQIHSMTTLLSPGVMDYALGMLNQANESWLARAPNEIGSTKQCFLVSQANWGRTGDDPTRDGFLNLARKYWEVQYSSGGGSSPGFANRSFKSSKELGVPFSMQVGDPVYNPTPPADGGPNPFFEVQQGVKLYADKSQFTGPVPKSGGRGGDRGDRGSDGDRAGRGSGGNRDGTDRRGANPATTQRTSIYLPEKWKALFTGPKVHKRKSSRGIFKPYNKYDYRAFSIPMPQEEAVLDNLPIGGQHFISIKPEYNFYISAYEDALLNTPEGQAISERLLPNLYAVMMEKENETSNPYLYNHITLGGTIKKPNRLTQSPHKYDIKKHSGQYFEKYARAIPDAANERSPISLSTLGNKFKNIIVPESTLSKLKSLSERKEMFPAWVDIKFSMDKSAGFANILKETHLLDKFIMETLKASERIGRLNSTGFASEAFVNIQDSVSLTEESNGERKITRRATFHTEDRQTWDITEWLQEISLVDFKTGAYTAPEYGGNSQLLATTIVLDDGTVEEAQMTSPQNKFAHHLMSVVFLSKLKQFLKSRFRTYDDLMRGKTNYTETVLYKVEKWATNSNGAVKGTEPLQNYWIPNDSEMDVARIIDTQVKHAARYKYIVYAYQVVFASQYAYSEIKVADDTASVVVTQTPKVLLLQQEMYTETCIVMDSPPVPPEAQIIPYRANKDNLLINLNIGIGDYLLQPIAINEGEHEAIMNIRGAQKLRATEPIRYKSDDSLGRNGYFEIFRLDAHPSAWTDFDLAERHIEVRHDPTWFPLSSASYRDVIRPNQKYYYMFRVRDAHGHISNPSAIYEVELVHEQGAVHFTKRVVELLPREPRSPSKPMRRLIEIKPAYEQAFAEVDEEMASALDVTNVTLGEEISPWGKRYKFRFVSKKTGKKIDLNIACKVKMEKGLPEGK